MRNLNLSMCWRVLVVKIWDHVRKKEIFRIERLMEFELKWKPWLFGGWGRGGCQRKKTQTQCNILHL